MIDIKIKRNGDNIEAILPGGIRRMTKAVPGLPDECILTIDPNPSLFSLFGYKVTVKDIEGRTLETVECNGTPIDCSCCSDAICSLTCILLFAVPIFGVCRAVCTLTGRT